MDDVQLTAMEAMVRAMRTLKQAKKRGIDIKPYRQRLKEAGQLFRARDYRGTIDRSEQIIAEVTGLPQSG